MLRCTEYWDTDLYSRYPCLLTVRMMREVQVYRINVYSKPRKELLYSTVGTGRYSVNIGVCLNVCPTVHSVCLSIYRCVEVADVSIAWKKSSCRCRTSKSSRSWRSKQSTWQVSQHSITSKNTCAVAYCTVPQAVNNGEINTKKFQTTVSLCACLLLGSINL